jgi:hypothetical protein
MKFGPASTALLFVASAATLSSGVSAEEVSRVKEGEMKPFLVAVLVRTLVQSMPAYLPKLHMF